MFDVIVSYSEEEWSYISLLIPLVLDKSGAQEIALTYEYYIGRPAQFVVLD